MIPIKWFLLWIFINDKVYESIESVLNRYFLTYAEVAAKCNTSEAVVADLVEMGKLTQIRLKNANLICVTDLEELLKTIQID